jgi:hypothetical protein
LLREPLTSRLKSGYTLKSDKPADWNGKCFL